MRKCASTKRRHKPFLRTNDFLPNCKSYNPWLQNRCRYRATGQYYFASRSSLLFQIGFTSFGTKQVQNYYENNLKLISIKGGYRYDIGSSGFFLNALVGTDVEAEDNFTTVSFTLGAGKRFLVKDFYFIDAGIDYIDGDTERRVNSKVAFGILRRAKKAH